jgi:hypothetical protein
MHVPWTLQPAWTWSGRAQGAASVAQCSMLAAQGVCKGGAVLACAPCCAILSVCPRSFSLGWAGMLAPVRTVCRHPWLHLVPPALYPATPGCAWWPQVHPLTAPLMSAGAPVLLQLAKLMLSVHEPQTQALWYPSRAECAPLRPWGPARGFLGACILTLFTHSLLTVSISGVWRMVRGLAPSELL